ncbi:MAG TPA: sugar phosphate isomerase/epimerase [Capsulimonadaceae bacterium]|jgi:sugar phosphate isomerase/epimerase
MTWTLSAFADEAGATIDEQIPALKTSGLSLIDIRSVDGYNIVELPVDHAKVIKSKLDDAGISVQMFGSPIGKIDIGDDFSTDLARLNHLGELAPVLGCKAVRMFSYFNKDAKPHAEWQNVSIERMIALREAAKNLGLVLYHENECHIFGDLAADVATIGTEVRDGVSFKTIFDFDNYNQGGQSVWEAWQLLKGDVDAIHLKDSINKQHVPVGTGTGDVEKILRDAVATGWNGPLAVEPHLGHSGAVAATGPSGEENVTYKDMPEADRFILACNAATALLTKVGASYK